MAITSMQVSVVSAEEEIFSGTAVMLQASGTEGELGIAPGHAPLLTMLKPGEILIRLNAQSEESIYVQGGFMEVQPDSVTVLSDTAVRAKDIDEAKALEAKEHAERLLKERGAEFEYAQVMEDLARALAQLRIIEKARRR